MGVRSALATVRFLASAVVAEAREERISLVAAGLAYYLLLFFVPLGLLVLIALEATGNLSAAAHWLDALSETTIRAGPLRRITGGEDTRLRAAVIAVVLVLWSGGRAFGSMNAVFTDVSGVNADDGLVTELVEVVVVLATTAGTFCLYALLIAVFARSATDAVWYVGVPLALFVGFLSVLLPVYYVFPPTDVDAVDALPGALLAAAVWTVSGLGFRLYAEASESIDLYGVVGVALLLMTWFYVGGLALLAGAVLNGVLERELA